MNMYEVNCKLIKVQQPQSTYINKLYQYNK